MNIMQFSYTNGTKKLAHLQKNMKNNATGSKMIIISQKSINSLQKQISKLQKVIKLLK